MSEQSPQPSSSHDLDTPVSSRAKVLFEVECGNHDLNASLQQQLQVARAKNAEIKSVMESKTGSLGEDPSTRLPDDLMALKELINQQKAQTLEKDSIIKQLQFELEMESGRVNILRHDNQALKKMSVDLQSAAEQEEENISNKLLKRISSLKEEKGILLREVEQEEDFITNSLAKKLRQLQKEKIDLENALEQEQEFLVNRLQKQLDNARLQQQRQELSPSGTSKDSMSSPTISSKWLPSHSPSTSDLTGNSQGVIEMLKAEVHALRTRLQEVEKAFLTQHSKMLSYKTELIQYRKGAGLDFHELLHDEGLPPFIRTAPSPPMSWSRRSGPPSPNPLRSRSTSSEFRVTNLPNTNPPVSTDPHSGYRSNSVGGPALRGSLPGHQTRTSISGSFSSLESPKE